MKTLIILLIPCILYGIINAVYLYKKYNTLDITDIYSRSTPYSLSVLISWAIILITASGFCMYMYLS